MKRKTKAIPEKESLPAPVAITVSEFCRNVPFGKSKFYNEVKASRIRILKAGRCTIVLYSEIQAYLNRLAQEGGAK